MYKSLFLLCYQSLQAQGGHCLSLIFSIQGHHLTIIFEEEVKSDQGQV